MRRTTFGQMLLSSLEPFVVCHYSVGCHYQLPMRANHPVAPSGSVIRTHRASLCRPFDLTAKRQPQPDSGAALRSHRTLIDASEVPLFSIRELLDRRRDGLHQGAHLHDVQSTSEPHVRLTIAPVIARARIPRPRRPRIPRPLRGVGRGCVHARAPKTVSTPRPAVSGPTSRRPCCGSRGTSTGHGGLRHHSLGPARLRPLDDVRRLLPRVLRGGLLGEKGNVRGQ